MNLTQICKNKIYLYKPTYYCSHLGFPQKISRAAFMMHAAHNDKTFLSCYKLLCIAEVSNFCHLCHSNYRFKSLDYLFPECQKRQKKMWLPRYSHYFCWLFQVVSFLVSGWTINPLLIGSSLWQAFQPSSKQAKEEDKELHTLWVVKLRC